MVVVKPTEAVDQVLHQQNPAKDSVYWHFLDTTEGLKTIHDPIFIKAMGQVQYAIHFEYCQEKSSDCRGNGLGFRALSTTPTISLGDTHDR
jgi:hypothetical protein